VEGKAYPKAISLPEGTVEKHIRIEKTESTLFLSSAGQGGQRRHDVYRIKC